MGINTPKYQTLRGMDRCFATPSARCSQKWQGTSCTSKIRPCRRFKFCSMFLVGGWFTHRQFVFPWVWQRNPLQPGKDHSISFMLSFLLLRNGARQFLSLMCLDESKCVCFQPPVSLGSSSSCESLRTDLRYLHLVAIAKPATAKLI